VIVKLGTGTWVSSWPTRLFIGAVPSHSVWAAAARLVQAAAVGWERASKLGSREKIPGRARGVCDLTQAAGWLARCTVSAAT
jgi:hypothetical protein